MSLPWEDMPSSYAGGRLKSFQPVTCFRVEVLEGKGVEDDPYRTVTYWLTGEGKLIEFRDPQEQL